MVQRRIDWMAVSDMDSPDPGSAKAITALVREARSLSRRADTLGGTAAAVDDPTTQQLAAAACTSIEQLVHHRGCLSASCSDARRRGFVENLRRIPDPVAVTTAGYRRCSSRVEAIEARSVRDLASGGPSARRAMVPGRPVFCGNESSSAISNQCSLPANRDGCARRPVAIAEIGSR